MPNSRSKYSDAAVSRRKSIVRDVLFGVLIGLAVIFVVLTGRFIYEKSRNPDYRLADLFGATTAGTLPTLPTFPIASVDASSAPDTLPDTSAFSTEETEETSDEETTEETPEETSEEATTEEVSSEESTEAETKTAETTAEETTEPSGEETTAAETTPEETTTEETTPEETTEPVIVNDPSDINYHLLRYNMDENDLADCRQLVVVSSSGTQCILYFFDKNDDGWSLSEAIPSAPGVLGRNGVTTSKQEGDGCTPAGYYALGPCYGEDAASGIAMEYHQIVEGDYWVDDASSEYYNSFVHVDDYESRVGWNSGENLFDLLRYYRYMVVIRYNMDPVVPGAGSAIFLHCQAGDTDTSGCVSTKEATVFAILRWLSPDADPHILIY